MSDYEYDEDFESDASPTKASSRAPSQAVPSARSEKGKHTPMAASSGVPRRASSQSSQRKSSLPQRRIVTPPSALVHLDTPADDDQELSDLRKANVALRAELLALNRQLDDHLGKRGQRVARPVAVRSSGLPSDKLVARNEQQRRANNELRERLNKPHIQHRMSEARNSLGHAMKLLEEARSENRGLENVHSHQDEQLTRVRVVEAEIAEAKQEHGERVRELKEKGRALKEQRESDMATYSKMIRHVERMEEKVKVQEDIGAAVKSVETVREQVEEKDRIIDALKYQVAVLSRSGATDKKKTKAVQDRLARDLHSLREEADSLRKQVKQLGMMGELGVDTRM